VKCSWGVDGKTVFAGFYKKKSVTSKGVFNIEGKPTRLRVNGGKPFPEIGVQLNPNVRPSDELGEKENEIVEYLMTCKDKLSNLNIINENADDEDINILSERLLFMHRLELVTCKRFFDIFNSKNILNPLPSK